jgi:hypothetical protein
MKKELDIIINNHNNSNQIAKNNNKIAEKKLTGQAHSKRKAKNVSQINEKSKNVNGNETILKKTKAINKSMDLKIREPNSLNQILNGVISKVGKQSPNVKWSTNFNKSHHEDDCFRITKSKNKNKSN